MPIAFGSIWGQGEGTPMPCGIAFGHPRTSTTQVVQTRSLQERLFVLAVGASATRYVVQARGLRRSWQHPSPVPVPWHSQPLARGRPSSRISWPNHGESPRGRLSAVDSEIASCDKCVTPERLSDFVWGKSTIDQWQSCVDCVTTKVMSETRPTKTAGQKISV